MLNLPPELSSPQNRSCAQDQVTGFLHQRGNFFSPREGRFRVAAVAQPIGVAGLAAALAGLYSNLTFHCFSRQG